jgi:Ca2+-binding EF-hand superfamily protein
MQYSDADGWFSAYLEQDFLTDFKLMDTDNSGHIALEEFEKFVRTKAKENPSWNMLVSNPHIIDLVHQQACLTQTGADDEVITVDPTQRIVTQENFRNLLIHLYATSILWTHFINADSWEQGADAGNRQLNFEEFKLACVTISRDREQERFTEDQLRKDFEALDLNRSNSVSFSEVRKSN